MCKTAHKSIDFKCMIYYAAAAANAQRADNFTHVKYNQTVCLLNIKDIN